MRSTEALALRASAPDQSRDFGSAALASCSLCGGPPRLCGGFLRCSGGVSTPDDLRWLTGIRATYAGLLLTPTPAALWGGCLLRMGRLVVAGTVPPAGLVDLAAEHAPLGALAESALAATLAAGYLHQDDHDQLWRLREIVDAGFLERGLSPWLADLWIGVAAALQTPLEPKAYPLFAVQCEACWGTDDKPGDKARPRPALYHHVDTYDLAIRCPGCGLVPPHLLPGVKIGEPHPVGRCVGRRAGGARHCITHPGYELDGEGLCVEGHVVMEQALAAATAMVNGHRPNDPALVEAVVKAQRIAGRAQGEANLRAMDAQMERFVRPFAEGGALPPAEDLLGAFAGHAKRIMGDAFETLAEGALAAVGLDKLLGKKKRKRRKAKRLPAKGATR